MLSHSDNIIFYRAFRALAFAFSVALSLGVCWLAVQDLARVTDQSLSQTAARFFYSFTRWIPAACLAWANVFTSAVIVTMPLTLPAPRVETVALLQFCFLKQTLSYTQHVYGISASMDASSCHSPLDLMKLQYKG